MSASGLLGDTTQRDYARKLSLFNAFAEAELRQAIASLKAEPGMRVLDAGCGSGESLNWWREALEPSGTLVGLDLSWAHVRVARANATADSLIVQADTLKLPFPPGCFDLIWCVNTIHHLHDPSTGIAQLAQLLSPGGRIALGQSSLLPEMYFAWDARLERLVTEAVRAYYRARYGLDERDLSAVRALVGTLRRAKLRNVQSHTLMIERVSPLRAQDEAYLLQAIFQATWGERLRPYLSSDDFQELTQLCDPACPQFALRRPDFHFLQSFTLAVAEL
jgi:SAM-dependent methyltransferase